MRWWVAIACLVVALAASTPAYAQDPVRRERSDISSEAHAATALYVLSAISSGAAWIMTPLGLFGSSDAFNGATISGVTVAGCSVLLLGFAIGLDVDSHVRRDALARRGDWARLVPGPGEVGVGLALVF